MELSPGLGHQTFSLTLLLFLALFAALVAGAFAFARHRRASIFVGAISSAVLILLAGDHIPVVTLIAPKSFCFGDIGVFHAVSFMLPIAAPLITGRTGIEERVNLQRDGRKAKLYQVKQVRAVILKYRLAGDEQ